MIKVRHTYNRSALKTLREKVVSKGVKKVEQERDELYNTLYTLSSAIMPFENGYGVAVKTGDLRRSITPEPVKVTEKEIVARVVFDLDIAPHALFVLEGTEKMPARPLHIIALGMLRESLKK